MIVKFFLLEFFYMFLAHLSIDSNGSKGFFATYDAAIISISFRLCDQRINIKIRTSEIDAERPKLVFDLHYFIIFWTVFFLFHVAIKLDQKISYIFKPSGPYFKAPKRRAEKILKVVIKLFVFGLSAVLFRISSCHASPRII